MKKIMAVLMMLALTHLSYAAELLVKANKHWQDDWDSGKVASLSSNEKDSYDERSQFGDIVVVRPDGWTWGGEECLPRFVVVKVPELSMDDAKSCEESLYSDIPDEQGNKKMLKVRRYYIKQATIQTAVDGGQSVITMTLSDFNNVLTGKNDKK